MSLCALSICDFLLTVSQGKADSSSRWVERRASKRSVWLDHRTFAELWQELEIVGPKEPQTTEKFSSAQLRPRRFPLLLAEIPRRGVVTAAPHPGGASGGTGLPVQLA